MKKLPFEKQIYAGLMEILRDDHFYYQSFSKDYNHLTEEGNVVILEYITMMAPHMLKREEEILDNRAKQMVINGLKS
jgi:hypothetical protein